MVTAQVLLQSIPSQVSSGPSTVQFTSEALGFDASDEFDGRTPLDKSIDRIGMGEQSFRL